VLGLRPDLVNAPAEAPEGSYLDECYRVCRDIAKTNSKTFYLSSLFLGPEKRRAVWAVYAFCRTADDIVDQMTPPAERLAAIEPDMRSLASRMAELDEVIAVLAQTMEPLQGTTRRLGRLFDRLPDAKGIYPLAAVLRQAEPFARLELSQFDQGASAMPSFVGGKEVPHVNLPIQSVQRFETEAKKALAELAELANTPRITVFCQNEG